MTTNAPELSTREWYFTDPLSNATRRERQHLLALSIVAIAVKQGGVLPTRIPALGIELTAQNQSVLFALFEVCIFYYMVVTIIYVLSDYNRLDARLHAAAAAALAGGILFETWDKIADRPMSLGFKVARMVIDFLVPLAVATYAGSLIFRVP